jgi:sugar/nucleoside kinase (ribokinase family)
MKGDLQAPICIVGNLNVDQVVSTVSRFPAWDEELLVDQSTLGLAGTGGYMAIASRYLGTPAFVVSTVGDDFYADFLRNEMKHHQIDDSGILTIAGESTCLGIVFVGDRGQRGILSVLGAHVDMSVEVAHRFGTDIARCHEIVLCGTYLLPRFSPEHVTSYAQEMRSQGHPIVFDPGWDPTGWTEGTRISTLNLLEHVDIYMPNEEEICHLTGTTTWRDAAGVIAPLVPELIIKRGPNGAVHIQHGEIVEVPAFPVDAVNTIGAGDVFDIAFLIARRRGRSVRAALEFACATSALIVSQPGNRTYPSVEDVERKLATEKA